MLTYSVVVGQENDDCNIEELILQTYSNEKAAREHEQFVVDCNMLVEGGKWDYVSIRVKRVADVFEKGE